MELSNEKYIFTSNEQKKRFIKNSENPDSNQGPKDNFELYSLPLYQLSYSRSTFTFPQR